ncbi:LacI family DNA-binding transcriptional regulator [Marinicrinis sediminis]|uniref:LacI family DNA-binding transcriptional regulator n=1 Tax=Marinicrinis sediminis TaxID=1652465 RepID=A0ABW5R8T5_9BACL
MSKPTIRDVSKKAGVSIATVSRVLNGQEGYSKTTKEKVLQVIHELGYTPNEIARGLVNKKTSTIGVMFPTVSSFFFSQLLSGIEEAAQQQQYNVFICNTAKNGERTEKYLQVLREKQVEGILFVSDFMKEPYYEQLIASRMPFVLVSTESMRYPVPFVKVDDRKASYAAVQYLLEKGHRHIGMISGTQGDPIAGTPRVEGYRQALEDYGLPFEASRMYYGNFGFNSGAAGMEQLWEQHRDNLTAVFAASDEMAAGAISACYRLGIRVPEQMSVIGYDNTPLARMVTPPLTAVEQPLEQMGKAAVKMLLELIVKGQVDSRIMPYQLVERDSVQAIQT